MRLAHETKADFAKRVMREKGFTGRLLPSKDFRAGKREARDPEVVLRELSVIHDRRFRNLFRYGPLIRWLLPKEGDADGSGADGNGGVA